MKILNGVILLGFLACGSALAADYSVGIVNLGTLPFGAGTGLNSYSISEKGIGLLPGSPYVPPSGLLPPNTNCTWEPAQVSVTDDQQYAYVFYYCDSPFPILVQFAITANGLVYDWQQATDFGDGTEPGMSTTANFVLVTWAGEGGSLGVVIYNATGQEVVSDSGYQVTGQIDPTGRFYYSCSPTGPQGPQVAVYNVPHKMGQRPVATSTDPVFVQSKCN
jgi:hypothetical protein